MDTSETSRENDPGTESSTECNPPAENPSASEGSERSLQEIVDELDAETLEQRRSRTSTTDHEEMDRCPECGSVKLHHKTGGPSMAREPGAYRCGSCGHHFDKPADADVDDQEVVTDGGVSVPEQIAAAIEASDYPELSIREVMDTTDLTRAQVVSTAGSMDRLELDRSLGVVRLHEDDGGEFVDDYEDELVSDGGEAPSESLKTALENADCHPDMVRYAEKAVECGGTPILNSLRLFHDVSDVSRIETVGTQIERSLWKDGAEATLRRHGHVDETNAEILQEIVDQQPVTDGGFASCPDCDTDLLVQQSVTEDEDWWCHGCDCHFSSDDPPGGVTIRTDGGQPAGFDEVELRIRTARANIAGLIPIFGMGIHTAQNVGALDGPARQMVSEIYDALEAEYPEADRREDLLDTVFHTNEHGGSWVSLEVSIDDVNGSADGIEHPDDDGDPPDGRDGRNEDAEDVSGVDPDAAVDVPISDGGHPPGHSPESSTPPSSGADYYVVDEARPAVVDGPLPVARAKALADKHGPDHIVAKRSAIQLLESAGNTTVRWETDGDVDIVTDGGRRVGWSRRDIDAARADAGVGDQAPGGCPHADGGLPCWDCLTDGDGGSA